MRRVGLATGVVVAVGSSVRVNSPQTCCELVLSDETDYILSFDAMHEASDHLVDVLHTAEAVIGCGLSRVVASGCDRAPSLGWSVLTLCQQWY